MATKKKVIINENKRLVWLETIRALIGAGCLDDAANALFYSPENRDWEAVDAAAACSFLTTLQQKLRNEWALLNGFVAYYEPIIKSYEAEGWAAPPITKEVVAAAKAKCDALWVAEQRARVCRSLFGEEQ